MTQAHKDILLQANAAVARGDHAGFLSYCTEDTTWNFVGQLTLRGKAAVRRWMDDAYRAAPPEVTVCRLISDGDMLTAVGEIVLTDAGGRRTHHAYCDVWRLVDFKLASLNAFVIDTDEPLSDLSGS